MAMGFAGIFSLAAFDSIAVTDHFAIWRLVTYAFIHPPSLVIWFLIDLFLLYMFGKEVERYLGRRAFLKLYFALIILPAALLTVAGWLDFRTVYAGAFAAHFGIFVAFVCLYPGVRFWMLDIAAKWWVFLFLALYSLMSLASHDWSGLAFLWLATAISYIGIQWLTGKSEDFSSSASPQASPETKARKSKLNRAISALSLKTLQRRQGGERTPKGAPTVHDSIDPLLDKISKHGLGSLDENEKAMLEKARASLLRKDKRLKG